MKLKNCCKSRIFGVIGDGCSVCSLRSSHPAREEKHLHRRGGSEERNPQSPRGAHWRSISGWRQQSLQRDADGRSVVSVWSSEEGLELRSVLLEGQTSSAFKMCKSLRSYCSSSFPAVGDMDLSLSEFPSKVTSCLPLASLMLTTGSWWASPVNPVTGTSSLWMTWTPSRRLKRSWWPLCVKLQLPVSPWPDVRAKCNPEEIPALDIIE